jgi:Uma2 family endonuclease
MTQAQVRFPSFEAYLSYSDEMEMEGRYALINGELVDLPPESEENNWLALNLRDLLIGIIQRRLVRVHACEVQVPVLQPKDPANHFPDLVVLREEHLRLTQRRLTITLEMPPPRLIAEVVSPGKPNQRQFDSAISAPLRGAEMAQKGTSRSARGPFLRIRRIHVNQKRDYVDKRAQYAAIGVPEYWLLDPVAQTVQVLTLDGEKYREVGLFRGDAAILSVEFAELQLVVGQIFETDI